MNMSWIPNLRFILDQVLFPKLKASASLGDSKEGIRYLDYFNARSWRKFFLRNKRYNCAIIDLAEFSDCDQYRLSVKGKNSADYFSRRCEKLGYTFLPISPNNHWNAILEINSSAQSRQGKTMDESYVKPMEHWPEDEINQWYGVFDSANKLVAYVWSIHMKELVLINRILGHDAHLNNNVMYLLCVHFIESALLSGKARYVMYDTFGRTDNGLAMFKRRIGFKRYCMNFTA